MTPEVVFGPPHKYSDMSMFPTPINKRKLDTHTNGGDRERENRHTDKPAKEEFAV